jgi:outer membrane lipoprotein carrier protein
MLVWRRSICIVVLAVLTWAAGAGPRAADLTAEQLAVALQRKYDAMTGFSADFVHSYRGGVLRTQLTERGHVLIKKPGKMRWEYTSPETKLFVSDGTKMYSYLPRDKQVIVNSVPAGDSASSPMLFLAGRGNIVRDFKASIVPPPAGAPPHTIALKLQPVMPQRDYDWLIVELDEGTLAIRGLITTDAQGGESTFSFTQMQENTPLADKDFVFTIPRGVDVLTDDRRD